MLAGSWRQRERGPALPSDIHYSLSDSLSSRPLSSLLIQMCEQLKETLPQQLKMNM